MGKIHQLLAVEHNLKKAAIEALRVAGAIFQGDPPKRLIGQTRTYAPFADDARAIPPENVPLSDTVDDVLDQELPAWAAYVDLMLQKETSNAQSTGPVVISDVTVIDLPAHALLTLEGRLTELLTLYEKLPTNTTDTVWHWDPGSGRWNADPRITEKMEKVESFEVIVQPTPEHPAHVEVVRKDVAVGLWTTTLHSGMLSLADKRQRIERLNEVLRACSGILIPGR